jgi:hypothetical protein
MSRAIDDLLAILELERLERNLLRGWCPQVGWQRVFGGQVIGQVLAVTTRSLRLAKCAHEPGHHRRGAEPFAAGGMQDAARDRRSVQVVEAP